MDEIKLPVRADMSQDSWNGVSWTTYLPNHVIAWRPLPEAAEIKRSEDEV